MVKGCAPLSASALVASLSLCREGQGAGMKMAVKASKSRTGGSSHARLGRSPIRGGTLLSAYRLRVSPTRAAMYPSQVVRRDKVLRAAGQTSSCKARACSPILPSEVRPQPDKPVRGLLASRPKSTPSQGKSLLTKRAKLMQDGRNVPKERRPLGARVHRWQNAFAPGANDNDARRFVVDDNNNDNDNDDNDDNEAGERECPAAAAGSTGRRKGHPIDAFSSTTLATASSPRVGRRATPRSLLSGELGDTERSPTPSAFSSLCSLAAPPPPPAPERAIGLFLCEASNNAAQSWSATQGLASEKETALDRRSNADRRHPVKIVSSFAKHTSPGDSFGKQSIEDRKKCGRQVKAMRPRKCSPNISIPLDHVFDVSSRRGNVLKPENPDDQLLTDVEPAPPAAKQQSSSSDSDDYDTDLETKPAQESFQFDSTGSDRYLAVCRQQQLAVCSSFLRRNQSEKLNLRYYGMGHRQVLPLACSFKENTYLTHVDLSYNNIGSEGVFYIAGSLKENQHISRLDLNYCFLGQSRKGAMALYTVLEASSFLTELSVSHNSFRGNDMIWFTKMLTLPSRLSLLDISDNLFNIVGLNEFAAALSDNEVLTSLNISWNPLMNAGCEILIKGVTRNVQLACLRMRHVGLGDSCEPAVATLVRNNDFLTVLDLSDNHLQCKSTDTIRRVHERVGSTIDIRF